MMARWSKGWVDRRCRALPTYEQWREQWRRVDPDRLPNTYDEPWLRQGLTCPTGCPQHQPGLTPWWSGESLFAGHARHLIEQPPEGTVFYHAVFREHGMSADVASALGPGDRLLSPATRRTLPGRAGVADDGCLDYLNYDPHAVYVTTVRPSHLGQGNDDDIAVVFEVQPQGPLWPDPERPYHPGRSADWCCDSALILGRVDPQTPRRAFQP